MTGAVTAVAAGASSDSAAVACEVGTGYDSFVALGDGDPVSIIAGPQGGFHIFTSVRVRAFDVTTLRARVSVRVVGGASLGPGAEVSRTMLTAADDDWYQAIGLINLLDDPATARDREVVLRLDAWDDRGASAVDERTVLAR